MNGVPLTILLALAFFSCTKEEVDIAALNTNRFDPAHTGPSFIHVDSITTRALIPGAVYQQRLYITLDQELYRTADYTIRTIETTVPDTTVITPTNTTQAQYVFLNQQVQLGTEYCFLIDISIGGGVLTNHRVSPCAIAEL